MLSRKQFERAISDVLRRHRSRATRRTRRAARPYWYTPRPKTRCCDCRRLFTRHSTQLRCTPCSAEKAWAPWAMYRFKQNEMRRSPCPLSVEREKHHAPLPLRADDALAAARLVPLLLALVDRLAHRERAVIALRYGGDMTLEEIGQAMGVTREWIRQVEAKALNKLRHPAWIRCIEDYA